MMIKFGESGHPVFRATSPVSQGTLKVKEVENYQIHFCADGDTIETVFRTIISVTQLSIYRAVSDLCAEYSSCRTRTVRPVLAGQSDPLFELASLLMTTPTRSTEVHAQEDLLQKYTERVERLSQTKPCDQNLYWCRIPDYSWSRTALHDKGHWRVLTIYRYSGMSWAHFAKNEKSTDPKGWIRGNTKIGPVLEVTTSYLQGKHGVEIRIDIC